jgi:hypothetical protein
MAPSLFDTPQSPLTSAGGWLTGTVSGSIAVMLCVLAMAFVGLLLMSGRLALRDAARVALACFVVLGASTSCRGSSPPEQERCQRSTVEKSRSRATNTETLAPCCTLSVG